MTGDPGGGLYYPANAVRWLTPPRDIAALVRDAGRRTLKADLFHFGAEPRAMEAELYLLVPGDYAVTVEETAGGKQLHASELSVTSPRTRVAFELPAQTCCSLRIEPAAR